MASLVLTACQPIQAPPADASPPPDVDAIIQNAMSAGLPGIAKEARIVAWPTEAGGEFVELRKGANGWTCYTDWPDSPTNDPMCMDKTFTEWFEVYVAGGEPQVTSLGLGYMLQGGSDPNNDDPFATGPRPGEEWMIAPPHVMIVAPGKLDPILFSSDWHSGGPWLMYPDTPYEHIMMPSELEVIRQEEDPIQNAMSAGPLAIAKEARVMAWPTEAGGEFVELRKGTNGWTCYTDWPDSPTNDPMCMDKTFTEWFDVYMAGGEPQVTSLGLGYMLQGGSDPNNDDPFATGPRPGEEWMIAPPHVMFVMPGKLDQSLFSSDWHSGGPWLMYPDTPYEHIMMPVTELSK